MDFNADKPIKKLSDDKLGRRAFSEHLGRAIKEYKGEEGLVIGLYGTWGSGKTSIIKMVIDQINSQREQDAKSHVYDSEVENELQDEDKNTSPIVIEFSPWNYPEKNDLIRLFFLTVENLLFKNESEKLKKYKVGELFADYADAVDAFSVIPLAGKPVSSILKAFVRAQGNHMLQKPDLNESRRNLEIALNDAKQKIVIVIDDIDRLSNEQIRDVFQLVKKVGDLPYVTYLLAMDREVVRKALDDIHNINGEEYLEKIIQIPFEIPMINRESVEDILEEEFDKVCDENEEVEYEYDYFRLVKSNCLMPYIGTLRQVNRVMNTFRFRYGYLKKETNPVDLLAITAIEVSEPELYKWISINGEELIYRKRKSVEISLKEACEKVFRGMGLNANIAMRCIATIFPAFALKIGDMNFKDFSPFGLGEHLRIANAARFDLYFLFDIERCVSFKRGELNKYLYDSNEEELKNKLGQFVDPCDSESFMYELIHLLNCVSCNRLKVIVSALLDFFNENHIRETYDSNNYEEEYEENSVEVRTNEVVDFISSAAWNAIIRFNRQEEKLEAIRYAIDKFDNHGHKWDVIGDWLECEIEQRKCEPTTGPSYLGENGSDEETKSYYCRLKKLKESYDKKSELSN